MLSSGSFERAFATDENRDEKSLPFLDMSRTRPALFIPSARAVPRNSFYEFRDKQVAV
jgi:hypothetical protein